MITRPDMGMTTQHPGIGTLDTQADALYVAVDALVGANRTRIITLALGARLPTIFNQREFVQAGGRLCSGALPIWSSARDEAW